jgi:hypothetical protein
MGNHAAALGFIPTRFLASFVTASFAKGVSGRTGFEGK